MASSPALASSEVNRPHVSEQICELSGESLRQYIELITSLDSFSAWSWHCLIMVQVQPGCTHTHTLPLAVLSCIVFQHCQNLTQRHSWTDLPGSQVVNVVMLLCWAAGLSSEYAACNDCVAVWAEWSQRGSADQEIGQWHSSLPVMWLWKLPWSGSNSLWTLLLCVLSIEAEYGSLD